MGMLWMVSAGWVIHLPGVRWRAPEALPEGLLMDRMRKFTLLDDAMRGFGGAAASDGVGEADRRRRVIGLSHPGGERRHLFGVGEGPAEAVAGAKQDRRTVSRKDLRERTSGSKVGQSSRVSHLSVSVVATC